MTRFKPVLTYDRRQRLVRLFRVMWERGVVGDGRGYSAAFSVALRPAVFHWKRELHGWLLTLAGLRLHYQRSYGGVIV